MKNLTVERMIWIIMIVSVYFWFAGRIDGQIDLTRRVISAIEAKGSTEPVRYTQARDSTRLAWGPLEIIPAGEER